MFNYLNRCQCLNRRRAIYKLKKKSKRILFQRIEGEINEMKNSKTERESINTFRTAVA